MAPTDDRSTRVMPKALVAVAALFCFARIVDLGMSAAHLPDRHASEQLISWRDMPDLNIPAVKAKQQYVPPPVHDISPESVEEIKKVLAESRQQDKYVLYEFYANWSDPCKEMEKTSLCNDQVTSLVEHNFMPVRVTDRLKELGKNPRLVTDLQKKFRIFAFPTLVIVDQRGNTAATLVGNCSSLTTYRFLSRALYSLNQRKKNSGQQSIACGP